MLIKSIVAGAVIALATASGAASAADKFRALGDLELTPMTSSQMAAVVGANLTITVELADGTRPVSTVLDASNPTGVTASPQLHTELPSGVCLVVIAGPGGFCG